MSLAWSDALLLDLPLMDDTHREFVDLLAAVERAPDADLLRAWLRLIVHIEAHFGQEDRWMRSTRYGVANCHSMQHRVVLDAMREGAARGAAGALPLMRQMAAELGSWFIQHAQSMDAALALHLRSVGYDPLTGELGRPEALPRQEILGCGGAACRPAVS